MTTTLELEISTPERLVIRQTVSEAQIPAKEGYIGVLPEHAPLLSEMGIGELSYQAGEYRRSLSVNGGWLEILSDHVRILTNTAESAAEIDVERAQEALRRAEERLAHPGPNIDTARALNAARRAQARLAASRNK